LIDGLDFKLPKGGIVGVIGPNGAGKTTLFRMLVGQEQPDGGTLRIGDTVKLAYVDQSRDSLAGSKTVWQEISDGLDISPSATTRSTRGPTWAASTSRDRTSRSSSRTCPAASATAVHLAKLLKSGGNVLLLDEPTNDLDVETLRALEEALLTFAGCAVIISHDRWFLDRIATHILAFEGDSQVVWFEGNYADYEADRKRRLGVDADQPHRIKYRKLA
jgi:sulfate-transporting ATPase